MAHRNALLVLFGGLVATICSPAGGGAQALHLAPPDRPTVNATDTLLILSPAAENAPTALRRGSALRVVGSSLIVSPATGSNDIVSFGNRTVGELADLLRGRFGVSVRAPYPEVQARFLADTAVSNLGATQNLRADPNQHSVYASLGVLYALDRTAQSGSAILENGGIQVDLVGETSNYWGWLQLSGRASLASNDAVPLTQGTGADADTSASDDPIESTLTTADQVTLSLEATVLGDRSLIGKLEFGVNWAGLDPFILPEEFRYPDEVGGAPVQGGGGSRSLVDEFDADEVAAARAALDKSLPIHFAFANVLLRLPKRGPYAFYIGGGIGYRDVLVRNVGVRFRVQEDPMSAEDPPARIAVPQGLVSNIDREGIEAWRALFGVNFDVIELRVDALGSLDGSDELEPVLRLALMKPIRIG